jgi:hypothetical protein
MISLGRKAVGRPKRHSLSTSPTDFSNDIVTVVIKRIRNFVEDPIICSKAIQSFGIITTGYERAATTTTTGGVQKE